MVDNNGELRAVRPGNLQANFELEALSANLSRLTPDQQRALEQAKPR